MKKAIFIVAGLLTMTISSNAQFTGMGGFSIQNQSFNSRSQGFIFGGTGIGISQNIWLFGGKGMGGFSTSGSVRENYGFGSFVGGRMWQFNERFRFAPMVGFGGGSYTLKDSQISNQNMVETSFFRISTDVSLFWTFEKNIHLNFHVGYAQHFGSNIHFANGFYAGLILFFGDFNKKA